MGCPLDGFIAGPADELDWLQSGEGVDDTGPVATTALRLLGAGEVGGGLIELRYAANA